MAAPDRLRVVSDELEDPEAYEGHRRDALVQMARYKAGRRVALADDVGLLFEDHRTLRHQVQEMLRLESDTADAIFRYYEDLQPAPHELVATLFIEVRRQEDIKPRLRHYARIERHIALRLDDLVVRARPVGDHGDEASAMAVTYLRFRLPEEAWAHLPKAVLTLDHPNVTTTRPIPRHVATDPHGVR